MWTRTRKQALLILLLLESANIQDAEKQTLRDARRVDYLGFTSARTRLSGAWATGGSTRAAGETIRGVLGRLLRPLFNPGLLANKIATCALSSICRNTRQIFLGISCVRLHGFFAPPSKPCAWRNEYRCRPWNVPLRWLSHGGRCVLPPLRQ